MEDRRKNLGIPIAEIFNSSYLAKRISLQNDDYNYFLTAIRDC